MTVSEQNKNSKQKYCLKEGKWEKKCVARNVHFIVMGFLFLLHSVIEYSQTFICSLSDSRPSQLISAALRLVLCHHDTSQSHLGNGTSIRKCPHQIDLLISLWCIFRIDG